jgi:hypothetical protein
LIASCNLWDYCCVGQERIDVEMCIGVDVGKRHDRQKRQGGGRVV